MNEEIKLKLSQFLDIIKSQFDDIIGYHSYTIEAEVKAIKKYKNFYYIDLVEIEDGKIVDSARSNIFNSTIMTSFLKDINISDIQDLVGKKLLLTVKPTFHKTYNFSINILKIYSEFYVWWLEKQKQEDIEELKDLDIFYLNHSTEIWEPSFHIAVISWEKSEWLRDFQTILHDSWFHFKLTIFPSLVHWEKASFEVLKQLLKIESQVADGKKFNAVAIVRWGWWSEWMNWTNDRRLCEAVCNSRLPIISAVWHTVDQSILDMVSRYDCKTPSEAAQLLIEIYEEYKEDIETEYEYIVGSIQDTLKRYSLELEWFWKDIPYHISKKVQIYKKELEGFIVDKKIKYHIQILSQSLENTFKNIEYNNPKKILWKWYSLVLDKHWKVINKLELEESYQLVTDTVLYKIKVLKKSKR